MARVLVGRPRSGPRDTNFNQQTSINISGVSLHNTQGQRQGQNFSHFADFGFWSRLLYTRLLNRRVSYLHILKSEFTEMTSRVSVNEVVNKGRN